MTPMNSPFIKEEEEEDRLTEEKLKEEVLYFETNCPSCNAPARTNMKASPIDIFAGVILCNSITHSRLTPSPAPPPTISTMFFYSSHLPPLFPTAITYDIIQ